mmetsp:Transcript_139537/g.197559  ORF Transcript_139537/g.197559 Transcript_139537/m.197559 type:complete len:217 (-) Transcript_139537:327-977(-)
MGSITIFFVYLSMVASLLTRIICFSVTTWIAESKAWKQFACCWRTRSSTQRTSSFCAETMSAHPSTASTGSMTSASADTTSVCGRRSLTASTACPWPQSSMKRSSACMADSHQSWPAWTRSSASCGPRTCQTRACCVICCGVTPTRTLWAGARTTAASPSPSATTSSPPSSRGTTSTSSAAPTRWWRTGTSSSPSASSSPSSRRPTTAASSTTPEL